MTSTALRITLFTRANCSLCTNAAVVLANLHNKKPFRLDKVDVMTAENVKWKVYEYDVPVIHVENLHDTQGSSLNARKLMHRFKEEEVEKLLKEVEK